MVVSVWNLLCAAVIDERISLVIVLLCNGGMVPIVETKEFHLGDWTPVRFVMQHINVQTTI